MKLRRAFASLVSLGAMGAASLLSGCSVGRTQVNAQNPPPALEYVGAWGVKGSDPGQMDQPTSIATDVQGNVYVADAGSQYIDKFARAGTPLLSFQDDRLKHPQSIAVDRGGAIYVSDPVRASVFVFFPDGSRYREIHVRSKPSEENTLAVTVGDDGSMSVLDVAGAKVFDFAPSFRLEHVWQPGSGTPSAAGHAHSIAMGNADAIYVGGIAGSSILRYADGKFSGQIDLTDETAPLRIGDQVAVSPKFLFVDDADGRTVHVCTLDGKQKADVDLSAQIGEGQRFSRPIAFSAAGELLVLDPPTARVLRYRINL